MFQLFQPCLFSSHGFWEDIKNKILGPLGPWDGRCKNRKSVDVGEGLGMMQKQ